MPESSNILRILHFNDVYHVAGGDKEPVGGAARFGSLLHSLQKDTGASPTLTLFSGDAYFPSLESSISRGEHMLPVLNELNIDASTLGNHEFDQGIDLLEGLIKRNNFPWVITNLTDNTTGGTAAKGCLKYLIKEVDGLRVGIIGIVEKEWLDTLPCLPPTFQYHDFVKSAKDMATKLKSQSDKTMACDLVICLSHMRLNNDVKLAEECANVVDLVLSGHDHFYYIGSGIDAFDDPDLEQLPETYSGHDDDAAMLATWKAERAQLPSNSQGRRLIKSGTDFRDLSEIMLELDNTTSDRVHIRKVLVKRHRTTSRIPENQDIKGMVCRIEAHLSKALDKVIGITTTALDARSTICRTQESNFGSLSGDLMRLCYAESAGVQIALLCGGAIRSDRVFPAGEVSMRNIMEVFPFEDPVVVVRLTGDQIRRALENGVSKWPAQEGRFPQVSGIRFEFDPRRAPGDRITSIIITAAAKSAAKYGKIQSVYSPELPDQPSRTSTSSKSDANMHRLAVENAANSNRGMPRRKDSNASIESDSDIEAESDYGDEEDEELDMNTHYIVATRDYMYQGHDGYEALNEGELIIDEENGITFSNLYRRYFYGLAVCNALRFNRHGYSHNCSLVRHKLADPGSLQKAPDTSSSAWKRLIIKHADNLRELARQAAGSLQTENSESDVRKSEGSNSQLASDIATIIERYNSRLATRSQRATHRNTKIIQALVSSAKRLDSEQKPMRIARSALFGHEDDSSVPLPESEGSEQSIPRNDDAGGLLPNLQVNREDTRSYTSENVLARWAVITPQTDGRIRNISLPE
ncbi:hypothetical protein H4R24_001268 [Coemansia sp. RSA 988]|nr:hypothetical protein H4R24_001268 [Coemansia sp. RSA 988]